MNRDLPDPELLPNYLHQELSDVERLAVEQAAAEDPRVRDLLDDMRRAEALSRDIVRMESLDMETGYRRVRSRIGGRRREKFLQRTMRWAAALLLPLLAGMLVTGDLYYQERTPRALFPRSRLLRGRLSATNCPTARPYGSMPAAACVIPCVLPGTNVRSNCAAPLPLTAVYTFPRGEDFSTVQAYERFVTGRNMYMQYWSRGDQAMNPAE